MVYKEILVIILWDFVIRKRFEDIVFKLDILIWIFSGELGRIRVVKICYGLEMWDIFVFGVFCLFLK